MNILMVCLGNICRSPLAEGILKNKLAKRNIQANVESAGTSDYHIGEPADPRMISTADSHGIDIRSHRARQFTGEDFRKFDRIYAMDKSNRDNILELAAKQSHENKVDLFLNISTPGENLEVPDPYFNGDEGFEHVFQLLDHACEMLAEKIEKQNTNR